MNVSYIKSNDHLTIVFSTGDSYTVYESNPKYKEIVAALAAKDYVLLKSLVSPVAAVKEKISAVVNRGVGDVQLRAGVVYFNGEPLHNSLTSRIISMANEGFDIEPMCKFLANLQNNPSYRAVNELYGFLEKGNLPITEDGYFLAYKKVRNNFTDIHSGKFSNAVGQIVEMPRNQVNEDPKQVCSAGLHFCSREYLPHFSSNGSGDRIMILKINPADVVAIPTDYNDSKGRTCRYEVIGELGAEERLEGSFRPSEDYVPPSDEDNIPVEDNSVSKPNEGVIVALDAQLGVESVRFATIQDAAEWAGTTPSAIRRVLKGERKTTAGYKWALVAGNDPHADNLAKDHEHGTLFSGRDHFEDDEDFADDDFEDDDDYFDSRW